MGNKLKMALISPRGPLYKHESGIWKKSMRYAPLTLTMLAALIPKEIDAEVSLYDEGVQHIPMNLDVDLIGISAITGTAPRSYRIADHYRKRGIPVVLGGVHPTLLPDEAAEHADSVVIGFAEQTWPQLIYDFQNNKLKKFYRTDKINLSNMPLPRRELLDSKKYITMDSIEATRGCVHGCEFCVVEAAWGNKHYQRPVEDVVNEVKQMKAKTVVFIDLNLIADVEYAKKLFKALAPLKIRWFGLTTVKIGWDDNLLNLIAEAGCRGLLLGLESVSREALLKTHKGFNTIKGYKYIIKKLHKKGIGVMGCFCFGLDGDDKGVFKRTVDFCNDANIDLPRFAIVTPFPNTALYKRLKEEGRILIEDWTLYDAQHVVFRPKHMTVKELYEGTEWAWKSIYSYNSIFKRLSGSRIQLPILIGLNLGYRYYAYNLHKFTSQVQTINI